MNTRKLIFTHSASALLAYHILRMGRKKDVSPTKVAQFVALSESGMSQRAISKQCGVCQSVVQRCLARHTETGSFKARKRPPRARVTSERTDNLIKRLVQCKPTISSTEIQAQLPVTVSARTLRRRLSGEMGLKSYKSAPKPLLSKKNIQDRLSFCQRYKDLTPEDWHKVLFSDETTIRQYYNYHRFVRRPPGQRYNPRYTTSTVKHPTHVMIWGSIAATGRCGLWFLPPGETINSKVYLSILKEKLQNFMTIRNCSVFQHDGAPCHTARLIKQWLDGQHIEVLQPWPGSSPDLNPIEHCWVLVKRKVSDLRPTSYDDLVHKIKLVWCQQITEDYCKKLVESMPDRIRAVLDAKGGPTRY